MADRAAASALAAGGPSPPQEEQEPSSTASIEALLTPTMVPLAPRGGITEERRVALVHLRPPPRPQSKQPADPSSVGPGPIPASGEGEELEEGAEEEVTVFLMHGACASYRQFARLIPPLAQRYRVVAFDAFGCGQSPKPEGHWDAYATEELFADLLEVYRRYKGRRNLLVGHSFGSSQVMRLAAHVEAEERAARRQTRRGQQPQQPPVVGEEEEEEESEILGLVLLASAYHVPDGGNPVFALPLPVLTLIKPIISQVFRARAIDRHADRAILEDDARTSSSNPMHMVKAFYQQLKWVPRECIHALRAPCCIVHGESDGIIPLYQARALAANLARAHLYVLRQTGHQVMQERPKEALALIEAFIEDLLRRPVTAGGNSDLRSLLASGEGMSHALHPGRFPLWARAEHEGKGETEGRGGSVVRERPGGVQVEE